MRTARLLFCLSACAALVCKAQLNSELHSLYDRHQWKELSERLRGVGGPPLYRGAIGVIFHQDPPASERLLRSVINANPHSSEAYEASEWLSHLYLYQGRYRSLVAVMEKRWAAFPEKKANSEEKVTIAGLRGLPDQSVRSVRSSRLKHEAGSIFIPLSINGMPATYFFDTGAWVSCMSESEAKRLHLEIRDSAGTMGQSAGAHVGFRTAVAQGVTVGNTQFRDVSFAIFPDDQEPWSILPPGRKGIVGVPLLIAMQTLRWEKEGLVDFGQRSEPFEVQRSNLTFDNDHLVIEAQIQSQKIRATVDTGAISTDFYQLFADKFDELLKQYGKKDSTEVRGVGHAEKFDSVTLPQLRIQIGDSFPRLSPAHVLLKPIGAKCCVGNFGMDLFKQGRALKIDFNAMSLQLVAPDPVH